MATGKNEKRGDRDKATDRAQPDYQREYYGGPVRSGDEQYENPGLGWQYGKRAESEPVKSPEKRHPKTA